jgi:hypothetical protein
MSTTTTAMPDAKAVRDMLADMLGRNVEVAPGIPPLAEHAADAMIAVYVNDASKMAAVLGMDVPLAAYASAAIGLVPMAAAERCVDARALTPQLEENGFEVCNMLGGLMNRDGYPHVRLNRVFYPGDKPPTDAATQLIALGSRLDLEVTVQSYGAGRFWLSGTL